MNENNRFTVSGRLRSFYYAFKGIGFALRTQQNLWVQLGILALTIAAGLYFDISNVEWALVAAASGLVLTAELFNTALEMLVDLVSPEYMEKAGRIKDLAAGAVLFAAIVAALIGLIVFIPEIIDGI